MCNDTVNTISRYFRCLQRGSGQDEVKFVCFIFGLNEEQRAVTWNRMAINMNTEMVWESSGSKKLQPDGQRVEVTRPWHCHSGLHLSLTNQSDSECLPQKVRPLAVSILQMFWVRLHGVRVFALPFVEVGSQNTAYVPKNDVDHSSASEATLIKIRCQLGR